MKKRGEQRGREKKGAWGREDGGGDEGKNTSQQRPPAGGVCSGSLYTVEGSRSVEENDEVINKAVEEEMELTQPKEKQQQQLQEILNLQHPRPMACHG